MFITFNDEASQRKCLNAMSVGVIPAMFDRAGAMDPNLVFHGNVFDLKEAPEVSARLGPPAKRVHTYTHSHTQTHTQAHKHT